MAATEEEVVRDKEVLIKEMIIHLLTIYPSISPTMLQSGLGPSTKPALWRPILEELIENDIVVRDTEQSVSPYGQSNTYTKLSLINT